ncbi:MAG: hypothetical protein NC094_04230 [Bacteroidales bacterium]|nr:hypothetical protein [Lachnoclostridium sp.]MCM1383169.1 hypothetical protein [Lachnoclostridium sp.]MCM1464605.1 hypothetical protein [Bacteroidales bacterium]
MKNYEFKKLKGRYTWQSPDLKLVFSDISFQPHDECGYVNQTENGIMYLYYTVQVYAGYYGYDKKGSRRHKWQLITSKRTYDFPALQALQSILKAYLDDEIPEESCQTEYYDCREYDIYSMETGSWFYDDYYQVERTIIKEDDRETERGYSLFAGSSMAPPGHGACVGVKVSVAEEGIRILLQCVTEFLEDAIASYNQNLRKSLEKEGYAVDGESRIIRTDNGKAVEMFVKGDIVYDISIYCGDLNSDSFYSEAYRYVKISEIHEDTITITGGYCERDKNEVYNKNEQKDRKQTIFVKNIISIWADVSDEVLALDERGIAEDLRTVLTKGEWEEIQNSDAEEMYQKWFEMIADRYIIYREEHPFQKVKKNDRDNAEEAVRTVIKLIKGDKK